MTVSNPFEQVREPFEDINEWTTENGTHVEVGDTVLVKPRFIDQRLTAEVTRIYWDPRGFPGGKFDHGDAGHKCILKVAFEFHPEDDEWSHMEGRTRRLEAFNLDFCVGSAPEIKRDRSNCNTERS